MYTKVLSTSFTTKRWVVIENIEIRMKGEFLHSFVEFKSEQSLNKGKRVKENELEFNLVILISFEHVIFL